MKILVVDDSPAMRMMVVRTPRQAGFAGNDVTQAEDGAVEANFYEVMNICSKLMMSDSSAHLRLKDIVQPSASADEISALAESGTALGFNVDIPRYGKGTLNFLVS